MEVTDIVDPTQCERFIRYAKPGEWFRYHIGSLAFDRAKAWKTGLPTHDIATRIYGLYERGFVHLVQRKLSDGIFEYFAISKMPPKPRRFMV